MYCDIKNNFKNIQIKNTLKNNNYYIIYKTYNVQDYIRQIHSWRKM